MKSKSLVLTTILVATLTVGGCDQVKKLIGGKPSGQVVATVNGEEITAMELRQEMGNFASRDPKVMKAAQQRALQGLILRRLLAQKAKEQKLDKSPDFANAVRRGEENLLVQAFQSKVASSVAVPTRSDAETYIANNPAKFAQRRVMVVDQVVAAGNSIPPDQFRPLANLEQVKALLDSKQVPYQTNVTTLDTLTVDPRMLEQLENLPPGEVFVLPQGGSLIFNSILEKRAVPFLRDAAVAYATQALKAQRSQEAIVRQVEVLRKGAEEDITYSEAYKPETPPAKGAAGPAAPAAVANPPTPGPASTAAESAKP